MVDELATLVLTPVVSRLCEFNIFYARNGMLATIGESRAICWSRSQVSAMSAPLRLISKTANEIMQALKNIKLVQTRNDGSKNEQ